MQRSAPPTHPIPPEAFGPIGHTEIRWLGGGGFMVNARGTVLLIDPAISMNGERCETGHRLLVTLPVEARDVPRADAILYSHADADHLAETSARELARTGALYVGPPPVVSRLQEMGIAARAAEPMRIGDVEVSVTPADHPWQLLDPARFGAPWAAGDCVGYRLDTPDGAIWYPGDTRPLDELLAVSGVDVLLLDASDDPYHLGVEGAARLANATAAPVIIPHHYGTYDAPQSVAFNGDPAWMMAKIDRAEQRVRLLGPGEPLRLRR